MQLWADLHIHSHYAMAASKDARPEQLAFWARRKGLSLIGTGDFTHPGWRAELKAKLEEAEDGLWRLKPEAAGSGWDLPFTQPVRFVISGEICTVYQKAGKTRKVHHLLLLPHWEAAERLAARLEPYGQLASNGRPVLKLDSRDLLAITLEVAPEAVLIPAHIWTPHYSVFGMGSAFNNLQECYADLTGEVQAVETGLSSDPAMNRRLSILDEYALVSNSDAHSPAKLGREATRFGIELSFAALRKALKRPFPGLLGTVEFFPEEGKYHWDGHRACGVCWSPRETRRAGGKCPVCGRPVTVGVLHRVELLADRESPGQPPAHRPAQRLLPLVEIIAAAEGTGAQTKRVQRIYEQILLTHGPELRILRETPWAELAKTAGEKVAEGVRRVREGLLTVRPGYDGVYGEVQVFAD
ncbi:MAG TPA: endonuclease Q family protein [Capillibacterium sp.]